MMAAIHDDQRNRAHCDILGHGGFLMRMPTELQLNLVEDSNIYWAAMSDDPNRPGVHFYVNGWHCDYFPSLSYERALEWAAAL